MFIKTFAKEIFANFAVILKEANANLTASLKEANADLINKFFEKMNNK